MDDLKSKLAAQEKELAQHKDLNTLGESSRRSPRSDTGLRLSREGAGGGGPGPRLPLRHRHARAIVNEDDLVRLVKEQAQPGDIVVCLGAGTISAWANALPARLEE